MEEILASIRKIIADDQKVLEARLDGREEPVVNETVQDGDEDVLDLGAPAEVTPAPVAAAPVAAPLPVEPPVAVAPAAAAPAPSAPQPGLLSETSAHATGAAFQSLANAVFTQNARTMDDLVKEMLRPMLKAWLDENLPAMVERLVRAEIERVARGGR